MGPGYSFGPKGLRTGPDAMDLQGNKELFLH